MFPLVDHPTEGTVRVSKVPVSFSRTPGGYYRHAETLGQSTIEVLRDAGYTDEQIEALVVSGAAGDGQR